MNASRTTPTVSPSNDASSSVVFLRRNHGPSKPTPTISRSIPRQQSWLHNNLHLRPRLLSTSTTGPKATYKPPSNSWAEDNSAPLFYKIAISFFLFIT
nr:hypothetical protein [Cressdnaviricota sp.]